MPASSPGCRDSPTRMASSTALAISSPAAARRRWTSVWIARRRRCSWRAVFGAVRLTAQIGVRHDHIDEGEQQRQRNHAAPRPGLGIAGRQTTLKANLNEGFKPPSFFALGFPIGGNPDLKPERSKNVDLTLARRIGAAGLWFSSAYSVPAMKIWSTSTAIPS